jgi:peptide chain release factor
MFILISSGNGGDEVCRALWHFLQWLEGSYEFKIIQLEHAKCTNAYRSIVLQSNDVKFNFLEGTHLWQCKSPFRPKHKRKNWYFTLNIYQERENVSIDTKKIVYQTMKSPKKGGQHVNTTNSGVRVLYPPLDIEAVCYDERSQHRNKKIAKERLMQKILTLSSSKTIQLQSQQWRDGKQIERGNPIKVFKTEQFREVF